MQRFYLIAFVAAAAVPAAAAATVVAVAVAPMAGAMLLGPSGNVGSSGGGVAKEDGGEIGILKIYSTQK